MDFKCFWEIYTDSFPADERRSEEQHKRVLKDPAFNISTVYKNEKLVGFLAKWDLKDFLFIEHFAIHKEYRGCGIGSELLSKILDKNMDIILEVEKDTDDISRRRIEFYKRLGFKLNTYEYKLPPYDKNKSYIDMYIMSYPKKLSLDKFSSIKNTLYKNVYNVIK